MGIDLGGARIVSQITDGSPVIQIIVGPGVDLRYLTLSNFTIEGNGREGDGIRIVADGNDRWVYNWTLENVTVQHVGGYRPRRPGQRLRGHRLELLDDRQRAGRRVLRPQRMAAAR